MEITLHGPPDKVREQAEIIAGRPPQEPSNGNGGSPENPAIVDALKNAKHTAVVKRVRPREWGDVRCNVEVARFDLPLSLKEIIEEVTATCGGQKYRIAVVDEANETVAADTFDVDGDPILPDSDADILGEIERAGAGAPKSASQLTTEEIANQTALARAQLDHENAMAALEEVRDRRKGRGNTPAQNSALDDKIARLERQAFDAEKKAIEAKYETQLQETRRQIEELNRRAIAPPPQDSTKDIMKMFMDMQQKSDEKFQQLIQQMQNNKTDQLIAKVEALKNAPSEKGNEVMNKLVEKALDNFLNNDDDDDEPADDPNKPWVERLADKYLPDIIDLIKDRSGQGKPMTKEEITAEVEKAAKKAEDEAVAAAVDRAKASLAAQPPPPGLPGPSPTAQPPTANVPAPAQPPPVVQPPPTIEQEIVMRAGACMTAFDRESALRVRDYEWPYEFWEKLPEAVLEKVCAADSPVAMLAAFDGIFDNMKLAAFKASLDADPKRKAWAERGFKELKSWWAKAQADPDFDPSADEEEDES